MKLLFIINPGSGSHDLNLKEVISTYFDSKNTEIDLFELPEDCSLEKIKDKEKVVVISSWSISDPFRTLKELETNMLVDQPHKLNILAE